MIGTLALEASLSTGEIILTGTLITIESSGLNCNKVLISATSRHLSLPGVSWQFLRGPGSSGVFTAEMQRFRGTLPTPHTVFILQIILEFSSFL